MFALRFQLFKLDSTKNGNTNQYATNFRYELYLITLVDHLGCAMNENIGFISSSHSGSSMARKIGNDTDLLTGTSRVVAKPVHSR
jgi:hypothetical protein